jgi:hypothetical protein
MNSRLLIPLCLAGAIALAWGSRSSSDAAVMPLAASARVAVAPAQTIAVPRRPAVASAAGKPQITSALHVSADAKAVHFAFDLTNAGKKDLELAFPSGQQYDFAVLDAGGREIYRWGASRMFTQAFQNRMLDGGQTIRIQERADHKLAPGAYTAVATLKSANYPVEQRVEFAVR